MYMYMYMYMYILLIVVILIIYNLICMGINMKCPYCYKTGSHFHLQEFALRKNHGPKTNDGFSHKMCNICMKNPGYNHFHFC